MKQTAQRLHIEAETVKWHRRRIIAKLDAASTLHAYAIAIRADVL